jgi:hypothetical protein
MEEENKKFWEKSCYLKHYEGVELEKQKQKRLSARLKIITVR